MHPFLRQALMKYHGEYFAMSEEEQTLFKLQDHDELDEKIEIFIEDKIGMPHGEYEASPEQILEFNKVKLPWLGIGPNSFMLNEWGWNEKILRFKNLYEANEHNHDFQEQGMVDDFDKDYVKKPLYNRVSEWARAFVDDEFYYLNLFNYAIWLYYDADELMFKWLDENLPYDYVPGKDDGKKVEGGTRWDKDLDAGGKEGWHKHMSDYAHEWTSDHFDVDITENRFGNYVYTVDHETDDLTDPCLAYVFGSLEVLHDITYYDFINDCKKLEGDPTELLELQAIRRTEFQVALDEEFRRIKKTMPPEKVEEDTKKFGVTVADGALDGLE